MCLIAFGWVRASMISPRSSAYRMTTSRTLFVWHPAALPELFVDRSLGRKKVPAILRGAGLSLRTLAEVYGVPADQNIQDVDWLEHAGTNGWTVLMKDASWRRVFNLGRLYTGWRRHESLASREADRPRCQGIGARGAAIRRSVAGCAPSAALCRGPRHGRNEPRSGAHQLEP